MTIYRRIDNQGVCQDRLFRTKESMRLTLADYHSIDWTEETDINTLSLDDLLEYGDWTMEEVDYNSLTEDEKQSIED